MLIELDETLRQNLIVFLQRVQLTGNEVPEYNRLMATITRPVELPKEQK